MKNVRFITMAGVVACCVLLFGSESNTFAQGKSGENRGNSSIGERRSTDVIQRGIERITANRSQRTQNRNYSRNRRIGVHTNKGVRDYGRGIGRGKGQGKGRGYAKRVNRGRNY